MQIVADENIPFVSDAFSTFGAVHVLAGRRISKSDVLKADMLLVRSVTPVTRLLLQDSTVKFVATATVGIDHIDTEWLKKQNIGFAYAPGSNAISVAQYVISALMYLSQANGINLKEITVGIVGVGHIGSLVEQYMKILGIKTLLCDPPRKRESGDKRFTTLEEIALNADVITFHVPLITEGVDRTFHLVNEHLLKTMKKGVCLINTSRGKVFDEQVLITNKNSLGPLVLDVWDNEPNINESLLHFASVTTPHIAGYSYDGKVMGTEAIYRAACRYFDHMPTWSANDVLHKDVLSINRSSQLNNEIATVILQAYPIEKDVIKLKQLLNIEAGLRPGRFDALRKMYEKRLEFSHYAIAKNGYSKETVDKLGQIGFRVVMDEL